MCRIQDSMPTQRLNLFERHEKATLAAILFVFVLISLGTVTSMPTVFADEPPYTDPAASLYFGDGFTSTMWAQAPHAFWCGNVPLYQFLLYLSFKCFGFGFFQARLVNVLLTAGGAFLIWSAVRRAGILRAPLWRLGCVILILSGSVSTQTFRTIRPDTTMFFVCTAVFFFSSLPAGSRARYWLAGLSSALLPVAGVPMLPYAGMVILIHILCFGLADLELLFSIGLGLAGGIGILAAFYNHFSSIKTFAEIVLPFTGLGGAQNGSYFASKIFGNYPDGSHADSIFTCFFGRPFEFIEPKTMFDCSAALLFLVFLVAGFSSWRAADRTVRRRIWFVILFTLLVPPVMHFAGHYRCMYRWMTYIPLTIATPWLLGLDLAIKKSVSFQWLAAIAIGVAVALGVPARTLHAISNRAERSAGPIERAATARVRPDDVVVCSLKAWFAVRPHARLVYCCDLPSRGALEKTVDLPANRVSLLCLFPKDCDRVIRAVGGNWEKVPAGNSLEIAALGKTRYAADFYRRKPD
jgi:4-amino-4-deoxy-L-arabinose transferase-like glycosyltransferase